MSTLVDVSNSPRVTPASGGATVLVVDDEPLIRDVLERSLRASGFRTITAHSGREALALYRQRATEIALVLLDIRMPDLSGPETMRVLRTVNPEVRCCFMSGDMGAYSPEELKAGGALHVFLKPFAQGEPITTLRQLIEDE